MSIEIWIPMFPEPNARGGNGGRAASSGVLVSVNKDGQKQEGKRIAVRIGGDIMARLRWMTGDYVAIYCMGSTPCKKFLIKRVMKDAHVGKYMLSSTKSQAAKQKSGSKTSSAKLSLPFVAEAWPGISDFGDQVEPDYQLTPEGLILAFP